MEDIDKAISILTELKRCTDLDEVKTRKIKFEELARSSGNESFDTESMSSIYHLNEETKALVQKVETLYLRGRFPEGIALDAGKDKRGIILSTSKLAGETTAQKNKAIILGMIHGDVRKIGVYGMGGIGKTTVMKHINNDILKDKNKKFDCVNWVTVSRDSSISKLQDAISSKLGLDLSTDKDPITRAGILLEKLERMGRYLLILDDLWEEYSLEDVGIPEPDSDNGCKLVLTTRSLDVCQSMKCEAVKMGLLSEDEAWRLFLDHVGHDVWHVKDLGPIIRDVASECARLPLAICTIGKSMSGKKEACEWRVALSKLRAFSKDPSDKGKKVIEHLKFSYDCLENKKLQQCLLFCALYPEDYEIKRRDLVELLALEGIVEEREYKRDEIDHGNEMLNKLINRCLLEGETRFDFSWVKMHDLVRDMALQIDDLHSQYLTVCGTKLNNASHVKWSHSRYLPRSATKLKNTSHVKWSEDLLKVCISNCYSLNESPICPRLTTLVLQYNSFSELPNSFFLNFKALKILNLSFCYGLIELPDSISDLVNLVGLLLRDCVDLAYVPPLAKLTDLRSLVHSGSIEAHIWPRRTNMNKVPEGLEQLSYLRYLNLFFIQIQVFPSGIIPRLSNLRYLVCSPFTKVSVGELMALKNLEMFKGVIQDIHDLRVYVKHIEQNRLTSYNFSVSSTPLYPRLKVHGCWAKPFGKVVLLSNCNLDRTPGGNVNSLFPEDVQELEIENVPDLTSLCALASSNNANDLLSRKIMHRNGVRELVSASSSSFALSGLEILSLYDLENLEALIGRKKSMCNLFLCLQELNINGCPRIMVLFDNGLLLSNFKNLEKLRVGRCRKLEEIIGESVDDDNDLYEVTTYITLPKLRTLELWCLPSLKSICPPTQRLICESLEYINADNCPNLGQISLYVPTWKPSPSSSLQPIQLKRSKDHPRMLRWWR